VESMSLRTIRIRSMNGTLHILPYSEAQVIDNRTKGFSAYVFDIGIGYDDDINKALEVMSRVGAELQADETYKAMIEQPLEIMGVDALAESAVMLKARFRTKPGMQWKVGRAYNKRIKEAFDAEGIEIPYRKLVVEAAHAIPIAPVELETSEESSGRE
jgi:moderate conductance mechanosensitive channel